MNKVIAQTLMVLLTMGAFAQTNNTIQTDNTIMKKKEYRQTAGRTQLGEFAPEFARLNDDILFGEVWNRQDQLSRHDRSLVTVLSLMAQGLTGTPIKYHLVSAKANGVTRDEIAEVITHAAFYCGWPKAWDVFSLAKDVWTTETQTREEFEANTDYPVGEFNKDYAQYFIGNSYLAPMSTKDGGPINVTFEPGCRNNWHVHHNHTQVLVCVSGHGWYQEWGKKPVELKSGVVITVPEEVKHWHGAASNSWMQHLTYNANVGKNPSTDWKEAVTDEDYNKLDD